MSTVINVLPSFLFFEWFHKLIEMSSRSSYAALLSLGVNYSFRVWSRAMIMSWKHFIILYRKRVQTVWPATLAIVNYLPVMSHISIAQALVWLKPTGWRSINSILNSSQSCSLLLLISGSGWFGKRCCWCCANSFWWCS